MVEAQFQAFKYKASVLDDGSPFLFPQEEVYLRLMNQKITLEDTG